MSHLNVCDCLHLKPQGGKIKKIVIVESPTEEMNHLTSPLINVVNPTVWNPRTKLPTVKSTATTVQCCLHTDASVVLFSKEAEYFFQTDLRNAPAHRNTSVRAHTPPHCVKFVRKQNTAHWTQTAFLIAISIYCSHHTNLYKNRGFPAAGSKETCSSLRAADLKETGAFLTRVSLNSAVFVLWFN